MNAKSSLGIGQHSYTEAWKPNSGAKFGNALTFLEYAHSIGAAGVQVAIKLDEFDNAPKIRARVEQLGAYFEGNLSLPKNDPDLVSFEANVKASVTAGATVARTACLGGRRYETFKTLAEFRAFEKESWKSLTLAEPILKRHKLKLAVENHKDRLAHELVDVLRRLNSEWIGACVDLGNSFALLENPYEVVEALAPFAMSSHIKDMGVQEYDDGFLLSEVILGGGFLDVPRMVATLRKANPKIRLSLEMITRDPLKIPCLTESYYATFDLPKGSRLAAALEAVKKHPCENLPRTTGLSSTERLSLEDGNVRKCLEWAKTKIPLG